MVSLFPFQRSFPPGIRQAKNKYQHEEADAKQCHGTKILYYYCPWVEEYGFHVEHEEQDGKQVVAYMHRQP